MDVHIKRHKVSKYIARRVNDHSTLSFSNYVGLISLQSFNSVFICTHSLTNHSIIDNYITPIKCFNNIICLNLQRKGLFPYFFRWNLNLNSITWTKVDRTCLNKCLGDVYNITSHTVGITSHMRLFKYGFITPWFCRTHTHIWVCKHFPLIVAPSMKSGY